MEYSFKDSLLADNKVGPLSPAKHIAHVAMGMLIISGCTVLVVTPVVFMTLFTLGSLQNNPTEGQLQSSVFLSKIRSSGLPYRELISPPIVITSTQHSIEPPGDNRGEKNAIILLLQNSIYRLYNQGHYR